MRPAKLIRDRHAQNICFAFVLKLAYYPSTIADAQGVMQHNLTDRATEVSSVFVVMAGARACAFPLHHVAETMRPLPIKPVAGTPSFICGVSIIREQVRSELILEITSAELVFSFSLMLSLLMKGLPCFCHCP